MALSQGRASNGYGNSSYTFQNSFPQLTGKTMPPDEKAKLLAMHKDSRANAGIYVAVVLVVYIVLLTILLCRYAKRQRPSSDSTAATTRTQPIFLNFSAAKVECSRGSSFRSVLTRFCCPISTGAIEVDEEINDYPLTTSKIDISDNGNSKDRRYL